MMTLPPQRLGGVKPVRLVAVVPQPPVKLKPDFQLLKALVIAACVMHEPSVWLPGQSIVSLGAERTTKDDEQVTTG